MASKLLDDVRAVERLRQAMRNAARLALSQSAVAMAEAERTVAARSKDLEAAVDGWNEVLARSNPDPALFGLAGADVVRCETNHKAAVLDHKIAQQRRNEAATSLAGAEARLEGASMIRHAAQRDRDHLRRARAGQDAEEAFLRWRRT